MLLGFGHLPASAMMYEDSGDPCAHHHGFEQCELDAQGGCEWEDVYHFCHTKGREIPCFKLPVEECDSDPRCKFQSKFHQCLPKDEKAPCSVHYSPEACRSEPRCKLVGTFCFDASKAVPCKHLHAIELCKNENHCEWDSSVSMCHGKGSSVECRDYFNQPNCELKQCQWNSETFSCSDKGTAPACSQFHDKSHCPSSHCTWIDDARYCSPKGLRVPCWRFIEASPCNRAAQCQFDDIGRFCYPKGSLVPCSRYGSETMCGKVPRCKWSKEGFTCLLKDAKTPCGKFYQEDSCVANGCEYFHHSCHEKGTREPCNKLYTLSDCVGYGCLWEDDVKACTDKPVHKMAPTNSPSSRILDMKPGLNVNYNENGAGPNVDVGANNGHGGNGEILGVGVSSHGALGCEHVVCPDSPSCLEAEHLAVPRHECCPRCSSSQEYCHQFTDAESCPVTCEFHTLFSTCTALDAPFPCHKVSTIDSCNKHGCSWDAETYTCVVKGQPTPCTRYYTEDMCKRRTDRCTFHPRLNLCTEIGVNATCSAFYKPEVCVEHTHCTYDHVAHRCKHKDEGIDCRHYHDRDRCLAHNGKCSFVDVANSCVDAGRLPPCSIFPLAACDLQPSCVWDVITQLCHPQVRFEAMECYDHYDEYSCVHEIGCQWSTRMGCHEPGKNTPCSLLRDAHSCKENNCEFHEKLQECFPKAYEVPCRRMHVEEVCRSNSPRCEYIPDLHYCKEANEPLPCDRFMSEKTCTANKHCAFIAAAHLCYSLESPPPCERIYGKAVCTSFAHCRFFEENNECVAKESKQTCPQLRSAPLCIENKCLWRKDLEMCLTPNTPVDCALNLLRERCKKSDGCGWDLKKSKCRRRAVRDEL